jgi:hypothetical protein
MNYSFIGDLAKLSKITEKSHQDRNAAFSLSNVSRLGRKSVSATSIKGLSTSPKSSISAGLFPS